MIIIFIILLNKTFFSVGRSPVSQTSRRNQVTVKTSKATHADVINKFMELYLDVFSHDGYGEIRMELKTLRRGQKELILHCGKQHRYVLDFDADSLKELAGSKVV